MAHLILDGTIISCERLDEVKISKKGREIDAWYAGRVRAFGGNLQALMNPDGIPLCVSDVLPGGVHDLTAARELVLAILWLYSKDMPVLAAGGYVGAGCGVLTPIPHREDSIPLHADQRTYNKLMIWLRCLSERDFALLTERWKALEHVTMSPRKITNLAWAAFVLVLFGHGLIS